MTPETYWELCAQLARIDLAIERLQAERARHLAKAGVVLDPNSMYRLDDETRTVVPVTQENP